MKYKKTKLIILFSILIAIFSVGLVNKTFQNDTFFYISIGEHILKNGIDMQEHFSWIEGLSYTYSHWAFDIICYIIYNFANFLGIHIFVILFTILTNVTLFICLTKSNKSPIIAFLVTIITSYIIKNCFAARSQIISFLCFIAEIYCIEQFIKTNNKKYAITLIILSVLIANFHAATWPLFLILFLPYIASSFTNFLFSPKIYLFYAKRLEKKLNKLPADSPKRSSISRDIAIYHKLANAPKNNTFTKITKQKNYNTINLVILMIIILFSGLLTPIHSTPYTYIINSMMGESNFENNASIDFILEMQPLIPINNIGFLIFIIVLITFLTFMPTKIKLEHCFLLLGLLIMTFTSARYVYLLVFLGSYVICDLIVQTTNKFIPDCIEQLEKIITYPIIALILLIIISAFSIIKIINRIDLPYVDNRLYPVNAVEYIKENIDYKNMRIYNSYNNGSYLMLNGIPVFIDSRLDVYCHEFNDTDVFKDYVDISRGNVYYEDVFSKYDFTHILLYKNEITDHYLRKDENYKILYEDDYFTLYERNI